MTEAAVVDGGAPAPAEAIVDVEQATHNNPLPSQVPPKEEAEKPKSTAEAIRAASETLKAKAAEKPQEAPKAKDAPKEPEKAKDAPAAKSEAKDGKVEDKPAQPKGPDGKFVSQNPQPAQQPTQVQGSHPEAPSRFSPEGKAAWAQAPEPVRAEAHRAIKELTDGLQKYKADADEYEQLREFRDMAKQHGTTVKAALTNYVNLEKQLAQNPIAGLEKVMQNLNLRTSDGRALTLRDVAAYVLGQKPEDVSVRQDSIIQELRREISGLKQQLGGVTESIQQQGQRAVATDLEAFIADPKHSRFEELAADIQFFLESDKVPHNLSPKERLSEAYKLAERLNPAPQQAPAQQQVITPAQPAPLNPAGQKSVSGAPSAGSDPATQPKGPVPSIKEALKRASAKAA